MTPMLLEGPALEPVTLAEMKAFLRLDTGEEDALVTALIAASRLIVEAQAGRLLIRQTWRIVLDAWPAGDVVRLPIGPVASLTAVRIIDRDGAAALLSLSGFRLDTASDPSRIALLSPPPIPGSLLNGIEIDVVAGFGPAANDVPAPLRQAIRLLAARWFERRGDIAEREAPHVPLEIAALIAPYRRARL